MRHTNLYLYTCTFITYYYNIIVVRCVYGIFLTYKAKSRRQCCCTHALLPRRQHRPSTWARGTTAKDRRGGRIGPAKRFPRRRRTARPHDDDTTVRRSIAVGRYLLFATVRRPGAFSRPPSARDNIVIIIVFVFFFFFQPRDPAGVTWPLPLTDRRETN